MEVLRTVESLEIQTITLLNRLFQKKLKFNLSGLRLTVLLSPDDPIFRDRSKGANTLLPHRLSRESHNGGLFPLDIP